MGTIGKMGARDIKKGSIIYFYDKSFPSYYGTYYEKVGLFAGQNIYNGNLADYHFMTYRYGGYTTDSEKVFIYGKNDYIDGSPIKGYYRYIGNYDYITILGINKTIPAFRAVNIKENHKNYFKFINNDD